MVFYTYTNANKKGSYAFLVNEQYKNVAYQLHLTNTVIKTIVAINLYYFNYGYIFNLFCPTKLSPFLYFENYYCILDNMR